MDSVFISNEIKRRDLIKNLKEKSSYYPSIYMECIEEGMVTTMYASTIIRVCHKDIWYAVHCVESFSSRNNDIDEKSLLLRMSKSVHDIQNLWVPNGIYEIDKLQISERDRLIKLYEPTT